MPASSIRDSRAYKPGQMVPVSGVYTVIHNNHRGPHQAIAIRADEFPFCRICGDQVRFHIARVVPHVTHDFDLAGPGFLSLRPRAKAANEGVG